MSPTELDKFYSLGNVEGLAFVDSNKTLAENQMLVSEEVALALAQSFSSIFTGLASARRPCKGFLVRTSKNQFLGLPVSTGVVILQLNPLEKIDHYFQEAVSIVGSQPMSNEVTQSSGAGVVSQPAVSGAVQQPVQPAQGGQASQDLSAVFAEFSSNVVKALVKVAPQNVAKKILKDATRKVLGEETVPSSPEQIVAIGQMAANAIPNAGRRKLVETELELITNRLNITA